MNDNCEIWELIAHDNFCVFNKSIARKLKSLHAAVLLGELASEYRYYKSKGLLDEDGMFFSTVENIEQNICLNDYEQRKALQLLIDVGVVSTKRKGLPAKRYIKLNSSALVSLLVSSSPAHRELELQHIEINK